MNIFGNGQTVGELFGARSCVSKIEMHHSGACQRDQDPISFSAHPEMVMSIPALADDVGGLQL